MNNSKIVNATTGVAAEINKQQTNGKKTSEKNCLAHSQINQMADDNAQRERVQTAEFYVKHEIKNKAATASRLNETDASLGR